MPMREECKHFQSRTYTSGEVARFCVLNLAPDAPWRCPDDCPRYERRLADSGWTHGSLVEPALEPEPEEPTSDSLHVLEEAEEIVEVAAPEIVTEVEHERERAEAPKRRWLWRRRR
jgi:hypothetical protein